MSARAWLLNFDADEELARPEGYQPRSEVVARFPQLVARIRDLVPDGDIVLDANTTVAAPGRRGRAFCPTPRAIAALRAAGAELPQAPSLHVLREVNDRAFSFRIGPQLPDAAFVHTLDELMRAVARASPTGTWRLKRAFAFAGRGRLDVAAGRLSDAARRWAEAALSLGGVEVAPRCERVADFGLHGYLDRDGDASFGAATVQHIDASGAWCETLRASADALTPAERETLDRDGHVVAAALRAAGYFGPFGIDAFRWLDPSGALRFHPRCELNARYSMGWAVGMGPLRPDL
jgi:hypothetical protein